MSTATPDRAIDDGATVPPKVRVGVVGLGKMGSPTFR